MQQNNIDSWHHYVFPCQIVSNKERFTWKSSIEILQEIHTQKTCISPLVNTVATRSRHPFSQDRPHLGLVLGRGPPAGRRLCRPAVRLPRRPKRTSWGAIRRLPIAGRGRIIFPAIEFGRIRVCLMASAPVRWTSMSDELGNSAAKMFSGLCWSGADWDRTVPS